MRGLITLKIIGRDCKKSRLLNCKLNNKKGNYYTNKTINFNISLCKLINNPLESLKNNRDRYWHLFLNNKINIKIFILLLIKAHNFLAYCERGEI